MIVVDGVEKNVPWQAIVAKIMQDEANARVIRSETPDEVVIRATIFGLEYDVTFIGDDFDVDLERDVLKGDISEIKVERVGKNSQVEEIRLPTQTSLKKIDNKVDQLGDGELTVKDTLVLDKVFQPNNSPFPNLFYTGSGKDNAAKGNSGDDTFDMGKGADLVFGSAGDDTVNGGKGKDTFDASLLDKKVVVDLAFGVASSKLGTVKLNGVENVVGTSKNDSIIGDFKDNKLEGGKGKDTISGGEGRDKIDGGDGADTLSGGKGKDTITGGKGDDEMKGGKGKERDTFVFNDKKGSKNGDDTILDWDEGIDRINIVGGKKSEVKVSNKNGNTIIEYDEGTIKLKGVELSKGEIDFVFLDLG